MRSKTLAGEYQRRDPGATRATKCPGCGRPVLPGQVRQHLDCAVRLLARAKEVRREARKR